MLIQGSIRIDWLDSKKLAGNPAGVSPRRPIAIYLPPEANSNPAQTFPVLYLLAPWTSAGRVSLDWRPFKESVPERLERLVRSGKMDPCIVVCPDLYTEYGGSQYIDSSFFGGHGSFIVEEVIPYIEKNYPVRKGAAARGVFGRSSGGFGALRLATDFPGTFAAVACHSGDMGFDLLFGIDFVKVADRLRRFDNDIGNFMSYCRSATKLSGSDIHILMLLGSAGFYSPDTQAPHGFALPIDLYSGEKNEAVWQRWLQQDPAVIMKQPQAQDALRQLNYLYIECGLRDQYHLLYGARRAHKTLDAAKVKHHYEEFDDDHSGTEYRFDISLPEMMSAIAPH
jgi:enterochelin esterase-like enzyme